MLKRQIHCRLFQVLPLNCLLFALKSFYGNFWIIEYPSDGTEANGSPIGAQC